MLMGLQPFGQSLRGTAYIKFLSDTIVFALLYLICVKSLALCAQPREKPIERNSLYLMDRVSLSMSHIITSISLLLLLSFASLTSSVFLRSCNISLYHLNQSFFTILAQYPQTGFIYGEHCFPVPAGFTPYGIC
jgi:hypothetical protein